MNKSFLMMTLFTALVTSFSSSRVAMPDFTAGTRPPHQHRQLTKNDNDKVDNGIGSNDNNGNQEQIEKAEGFGSWQMALRKLSLGESEVIKSPYGDGKFELTIQKTWKDDKKNLLEKVLLVLDPRQTNSRQFTQEELKKTFNGVFVVDLANEGWSRIAQALSTPNIAGLVITLTPDNKNFKNFFFMLQTSLEDGRKISVSKMDSSDSPEIAYSISATNKDGTKVTSLDVQGEAIKTWIRKNPRDIIDQSIVDKAITDLKTTGTAVFTITKSRNSRVSRSLLSVLVDSVPHRMII